MIGHKRPWSLRLNISPGNSSPVQSIVSYILVMGRFWVLLNIVPYSGLWTIWNKLIVSTLDKLTVELRRRDFPLFPLRGNWLPPMNAAVPFV